MYVSLTAANGFECHACVWHTFAVYSFSSCCSSINKGSSISTANCTETLTINSIRIFNKLHATTALGKSSASGFVIFFMLKWWWRVEMRCKAMHVLQVIETICQLIANEFLFEHSELSFLSFAIALLKTPSLRMSKYEVQLAGSWEAIGYARLNKQLASCIWTVIFSKL